MAESEVTYQISCQLCGWNTAGTIQVDEANVFAEILRVLGRCSAQHLVRGPAGKLLIVWEPLSSEVA